MLNNQYIIKQISTNLISMSIKYITKLKYLKTPFELPLPPFLTMQETISAPQLIEFLREEKLIT